MKKKLIFTIFISVWSIITILALTWGNKLDWPDNVHVDYGFPFVWSTQTLSTIVGAVNIWSVDIALLTMDLIFWLGIMVIISLALIYIVRDKN
ncbi:MAG: hypothetical protein P8X91_00910 [Candidatus Bathyarchaeota archaeon]|jgi:hypothetical protein